MVQSATPTPSITHDEMDDKMPSPLPKITPINSHATEHDNNHIPHLTFLSPDITI